MTTTAPAGDPESGVTVREAERADLLAVFHIEQEAFPQPWPFSAFERFLDEPGFLVADTVPNHGEALGHVKDIAVAPECRGAGVGKQLLGAALRTLAGEGAASVKLEVRRSNDAARSLYEEFGFEHRNTVPRYYDNGEDALVLVRDF